jgi:hypothetical protein
MAAPRSASCPVRERLVGEYRLALVEYHEAIATLVEAYSVQEADEQTTQLFNALLAAQEALKAHDLDHGCLAAPGA